MEWRENGRKRRTGIKRKRKMQARDKRTGKNRTKKRSQKEHGVVYISFLFQFDLKSRRLTNIPRTTGTAVAKPTTNNGSNGKFALNDVHV